MENHVNRLSRVDDMAINLMLGIIPVGSEEAPIEELASVRHSNGSCGFPASRFHEWAFAM
jgi:hypothetical protein